MTAAILRPTPNITRECVNIESVGCERTVWSGDDFDCTTILQTLINRMSAASNSVEQRIYVPGGAWLITDTLTIPAKTGICIEGNGIGIGLAETQYNGSIGGPASRIMWGGDLVKPMIRDKSCGAIFRGLMLQGWRNNLYNPIQSGANIASYAACGILKETQQSGLGTGKNYFDAMALTMLRIGIQFGETYAADNADQMIGGFLYLSHCDTGIKLVNRQSVGHVISYLKGFKTNIMIDAQAGGNMSITSAVMLQPNSTFLRTNVIDINTQKFWVGNLKADNNSSGTTKILDMQTPAYLNLDIGLHVGNTIAPKFVAKGKARVHIREACNVPAAMLQGISNGSEHPYFWLDGGSLRSGVASTQVVDPASTGTTRLKLVGVTNDDTTEVTDTKLTYVNGVLT